MSDKLKTLFDSVADTLIQAVAIKEVVVVNENGDKTTEVFLPAPGHIGNAIAFLKNNNFTAADDNDKLTELKSRLAARRRPVLPRASLEDAVEDASFQMTGMGGIQ